MQTFVLNNGISVPAVGFGTFKATGDVCEDAVANALGAGYRIIDTANIYMNERAVGRGIARSGVPREEIFLTSKLWPIQFPYKKAVRAIDETLARLGTGYLDLMLLHKPFGDVKGAYHALEEAVENGKIRMIGVSNFIEEDIEDLLTFCNIKPVLDQIEIHPYYYRKGLCDYLKNKDILPQSWCPLGSGNKKLFESPTVTRIASAHSKTPAQVILRWHLEQGYLAIPGTRSATHVRENLDIFDFSLTEEEIAALSSLPQGKSVFPMKRGIERYAVFFQRMNYNRQK